MGVGGSFPANPDLADTLGNMDFVFESFHVFYFCWMPNFRISMSTDLQIPRFPDTAASGAGARRTLRSEPDPSPNAPRDQIRRKESLLRPRSEILERKVPRPNTAKLIYQSKSTSRCIWSKSFTWTLCSRPRRPSAESPQCR